jgi:hypothetical protein
MSDTAKTTAYERYVQGCVKVCIAEYLTYEQFVEATSPLIDENANLRRKHELLITTLETQDAEVAKLREDKVKLGEERKAEWIRAENAEAENAKLREFMKAWDRADQLDKMLDGGLNDFRAEAEASEELYDLKGKMVKLRALLGENDE